MTTGQIIVAIVVAILGLIGTSIGSVLAYIQFVVKRKDEKEEKTVQSQIDTSVGELRTEVFTELDKVSKERSAEGAERFRKHAESIEEINKQIEENSKQISELTDISKNVLKSMDSLNNVVKVSAESQRNSNYDRLLIVTNKILKSGKMTFSDKTNLNQLYKSWKDLNGTDPKMDTMYEECVKIKPELEGE